MKADFFGRGFAEILLVGGVFDAPTAARNSAVPHCQLNVEAPLRESFRQECPLILPPVL